jgi:hypothetical protein
MDFQVAAAAREAAFYVDLRALDRYCIHTRDGTDGE